MVNIQIIVGRLGRDPEFNKTPSGKSVCTLYIATNNSRKKDAEPEWHRVICWAGMADYAKRKLKKGSLVFVEGSTETQEYKDKQSGEMRKQKEVIASDLKGLYNLKND